MAIGGVGIERVVRATERNARSEKARQSVRVKWWNRDEHKAFALELNSKLKVRFRMEAARQIADAIELKFNPTSYDVDTIDRWLRDSGRVDPEIARALMAWARAVQERLARRDPVDVAIRAIQQYAASEKKPLWWALSD